MIRFNACSLRHLAPARDIIADQFGQILWPIVLVDDVEASGGHAFIEAWMLERQQDVLM